MNLAITVIGKDRSGIIAALSGAVFKAGGNLEDASMTVLEGEFAMILLASVKTHSALVRLKRILGPIERTYRLSISIKEIKRSLVRGEKHRRGTNPWVVSVLGKDRAGIVFQVSNAIASQQLNITDLNSKIMGKGSKASYVLVIEVDIPQKEALVQSLRKKFKAIEKKLRVRISFNPLATACL
jgi:glycine cleavage system transcriptional repressor